MLEYDNEPPKPAYEVGYGKPPRHTRFQKGVSGNPKGRVKGSHNYRTDVTQMLKAPVMASQNGKQQYLTTQQAILGQLRVSGLKGNLRAIKMIDELARLNDSAAHQNNSAAIITDEQDRVLMDRAVARRVAEIAASSQGTKSTTESEQPQSEVQPEKTME